MKIKLSPKAAYRINLLYQQIEKICRSFIKSFFFVLFSILLSLIIFKVVDLYSFTAHTQIEFTDGVSFRHRVMAYNYFAKLNKMASQPKAKTLNNINTIRSSSIERIILLDGYTATIIASNYVALESKSNGSYVKKLSCVYSEVARFKFVSEVGWTIPETYAVKRNFNSDDCKILNFIAGDVLNGQTAMPK